MLCIAERFILSRSIKTSSARLDSSCSQTVSRLPSPDVMSEPFAVSIKINLGLRTA